MKLQRFCAYSGLLASLGVALASCVPDAPEWAEADGGGVLDTPGPEGLAPATAPVHGIVMCHIPPGNPSARHTAWVSYSAVQAHLAHGDHPGSCNDECTVIGGQCVYSAECCTGNCNFGVCSPPIGACLYAGESCTFDHQCCSGSCLYGTCSGSPGACVRSGESCTFDHQCCGGSCYYGTCEGAHGSCRPGGRTCTYDDQCCSGGCIHGLCAPGDL